MAEQRTGAGFGGTKIIRHRLDKIDVYDITSNELKMLEQGTWSDYLFDIAIALLSISVILLVTLITVTFTDVQLYVYFKYALVATAVLCAVSVIGWLLLRRAKSAIIETVRSRQPEIEY